MNGGYSCSVRGPVGKAVTEAMLAEYPDWTDQQIAEKVNEQVGKQVITEAEVARWRPEATR